MRKIALFVLVAAGTLYGHSLKISNTQANTIAQKIWANEGAKSDRYLVWWNNGEDFASLGIGHFIWFPKGANEPFNEVFKAYIAYAKAHHASLPHWLTPTTALPWSNKEAFFAAKKAKTKRYRELFSFLKNSFDLQAQFMVDRLQQALAKMQDSLTDKTKRQQLAKAFWHIVLKEGKVDSRGLYLLVDYLNFKGEGILKTERYHGYGWGLRQLLLGLDLNASNKYKAFANRAKFLLQRRIENSPKVRNEIRWRRGWFKRLDSYWR